MKYAILPTPEGKSIWCARCGMTSYSAQDVEWRYCGACKVFHDDEFVVWTLYDHPSDYPDVFVARCYSMRNGAPLPAPVETAATLEELRAKVQARSSYVLSPIGRSEHDDPVIVESWL